MLYQVAAAELEPEQIATRCGYPPKLPNTNFVMAEVA